MPHIVLLDAGVIGLACPASRTPIVDGFQQWVDGLLAQGVDIVIPDVARYEVLRELVRLRAWRRRHRLDNFCSQFLIGPVTAEAWEKAAEFWAIVRQAGRPTAHPEALDADAILAGVAAMLGRPGDQVVIATTNVRHLSWFHGIDAQRWEDIA